MEIAVRLCEEIKAAKPKRIEKVRRNYLDINIPYLIEKGHIKLNYPVQKESYNISRIEGFAVFIDMRGFSEWAKNTDNKEIAELYDFLCVRVVEMARYYQYDYWKMLGDGVMLIWEKEKDGYEVTGSFIAEAMIGLQRDYAFYKNMKKSENIELPAGMGISICKGELIKYESVTFYELCIIRDYMGVLVNTAARFQSIARAGEIIVNNSVAKEYGLNKCENITEEKTTELARLKGVPKEELASIYKLNINKGENK